MVDDLTYGVIFIVNARVVDIDERVGAAGEEGGRGGGMVGKLRSERAEEELVEIPGKERLGFVRREGSGETAAQQEGTRTHDCYVVIVTFRVSDEGS